MGRMLVLPTRASWPIRSNETIRSKLIKDSDSFRSRAQELEILNILNWPEVMWSGAVLEGNEIVLNLVEMGDGHLAGGYDGYAPEPGSEQLTPEQLESCWNVLETKTVPKGWRERLTPRQAREFEIIYCRAVLMARKNHELEDCAWMREGETVGCYITDVGVSILVW